MTVLNYEKSLRQPHRRSTFSGGKAASARQGTGSSKRNTRRSETLPSRPSREKKNNKYLITEHQREPGSQGGERVEKKELPSCKGKKKKGGKKPTFIATEEKNNRLREGQPGGRGDHLLHKFSLSVRNSGERPQGQERKGVSTKGPIRAAKKMRSLHRLKKASMKFGGGKQSTERGEYIWSHVARKDNDYFRKKGTRNCDRIREIARFAEEQKRKTFRLRGRKRDRHSEEKERKAQFFMQGTHLRLRFP